MNQLTFFHGSDPTKNGGFSLAMLDSVYCDWMTCIDGICHDYIGQWKPWGPQNEKKHEEPVKGEGANPSWPIYV